MSDLIDRCNSTYEVALDEAIQAARTCTEDTFKVRGKCHWCNEQLADRTAVFCDDGCRDDYEESIRRHQRLYAS